MAPATAFRPYCKMAPPHCRGAPLSSPSHCSSQSALTSPGQKWEENSERAAEPQRAAEPRRGGRGARWGWEAREAGLPARGGLAPAPPGAALPGAPRLRPSQPPSRLGRAIRSLRVSAALSAAGLRSHPAPLSGANAPLKCFEPQLRLPGEVPALPAQSSWGEAENPGPGAASDRPRIS